MVGAGRKGETLLTCYRDNHDDVTGIYIEEANSKSNSKFDSRSEIEREYGRLYVDNQSSMAVLLWNSDRFLFVSFFLFLFFVGSINTITIQRY